MPKRPRAPRPATKKKVHLIKAGGPDIQIPQRTVFSQEDEDLTREQLSSIEIHTEASQPDVMDFDIATHVNIDRVLQLWQKYAETFAPLLEDCVARTYAMTEAMAVMEKELRASNVDPRADMLGSIKDEVQAIVNQRILLLVTSFMFEEAKDADRMSEKLMESLNIKHPKSAMDFLRRTLGKSEVEGNPYGEPTKLGVTQSYE